MARGPDTIPPEVLLDDASPPMREIAEALRALVLRARPDAIERVRPRWGLLGYDVPVGRRSRYFAWIWAQPEHVHLGFEWGVAMDDPYGLIHGRTKRVRWTTWDRLAQLDAPTRTKLEWLVREAAEVAALGPDERWLRRLSRAEARAADPP